MIKKQNGSLWIIIVFIIAALLAVGLFFTGDQVDDEDKTDLGSGDKASELQTDGFGDPSLIREPNQDDHINGSLDAPIIIIEYSDTECPFCSRLHKTLGGVVNDYDGQVAWVYRHLPLQQLHTKSVIEAQATECASDIGGEEAFWIYINRIYEITPGNNGLDLNLLPEVAEFAGLSVDDFNTCMKEKRTLGAVEEDFREAIQVAGSKLGTPLNVVIAPDGTPIPISGALPRENWDQIISQLLSAQTE